MKISRKNSIKTPDGMRDMNKEDLINLSCEYVFGVKTRYVKLDDALRVIDGLERDVATEKTQNKLYEISLDAKINEIEELVKENSELILKKEIYTIDGKERVGFPAKDCKVFNLYGIDYFLSSTIVNFIDNQKEVIERLTEEKREKQNIFDGLIEVEMPPAFQVATDMPHPDAYPNPYTIINNFYVSKKGFDFIKKLQEENEELKEKVKDNEKELKDKKKECQYKYDRICELEAGFKDDSPHIAFLKSLNGSLRDDLDKLKKENAELKGHLEMDCNYGEFIKRICELNVENSEFKVEIKRLKSKVNRLIKGLDVNKEFRETILINNDSVRIYESNNDSYCYVRFDDYLNK